MKTLNLFLKMHFTSLSPDGQPISLAIVTSDYYNTNDSGVEGIVGGIGSKSFYSEFTDFDISRCDDWVKGNIISKFLGYEGYEELGKTDSIIKRLKQWLSRFYDYRLNFIVDCGWFTWYKFVELMAEWEEFSYKDNGIKYVDNVRVGLPKLPENFPCVPIDLNDLIMDRKGFKSAQDAFNLDREELATKLDDSPWALDMKYLSDAVGEHGKYNALWDAKVTKIIYEKLK